MHTLSRTKHNRLAALCTRLNTVFETLDALPRTGPAPSALRGETRRILNAMSAFLPEGALTHASRLTPTSNPQMFDIFVAVCEAIVTLKPLFHQLKSEHSGTYVRALERV